MSFAGTYNAVNLSCRSNLHINFLAPQEREEEMRELMAWMQEAEGEGPGGEEIDPLLSLAAHAETQATPMPLSSRKVD